MGRWTRRFMTYTRPTVLGRSDICHWCGHPGAQDVDHHPIPYVVLKATDPAKVEDPDYCLPIHGRAGCPYCPPRPSRRRGGTGPRCCNQEKGARVNATPPTAGSRPW